MILKRHFFGYLFRAAFTSSGITAAPLLPNELRM
jgi:hypothetical protein